MAKTRGILYHVRMDNGKEHNVINVCQGPECREWGGPELLHQLNRQGLPTSADHCQGLCHFAPIVHLNQHCIAEATIEKIVVRLET